MNAPALTALLFMIPGTYWIWDSQDAMRSGNYGYVGFSLIFFVIAAGLIFRARWSYYATRVVLWIALVGSVIGLLMIPNLGESHVNSVSRSLTIDVLILLASGFLLYKLETDPARKQFGLA
jgi:hypothetical protein